MTQMAIPAIQEERQVLVRYYQVMAVAVVVVEPMGAPQPGAAAVVQQAVDRSVVEPLPEDPLW